jgi:RimJ/RimL family protein N-acetyltransferase
MSQIIITTPRLKLRHWKDEEAEPFIKMNMDKEVMRFFPSTQTAEETIAQIGRIKQHFTDFGYGLYAVERTDNGQFIGYTGFAHPRFESFFTPCVEIGWRLGKDNWHQGFATEAALACLKYGFDEIGFKEIFSFTAVINKPSENVMERAGLNRVGDFEHPALPDGHILKPHVLYKIALNNVDL